MNTTPKEAAHKSLEMKQASAKLWRLESFPSFKKPIHHSNFPSSYSLSCLSDFFRYLGLYKLHWETASVVELKTDQD